MPNWLIEIVLRCECESDWLFVFQPRPNKGKVVKRLVGGQSDQYYVPLSRGRLSLFSEGGAVGQSVEERRVAVAELQAVFKATGFPFHIVPLEQVCACDVFDITYYIYIYHLLIFDVLLLVSRKCKNTTCSAVRGIQYAYTLYSSVFCALLTECAKRLSGSDPSQ